MLGNGAGLSNTYRERDANKLSRATLDRLAEAERMTLDQYREDLAHRDEVRARYAELEPDCDACVSLSAPAAAPLGVDSTGDPNCTVHASLLGIPAISLPVPQDDGLPLGLQIAGFVNGDAQIFAIAAAIKPLFRAASEATGRSPREVYGTEESADLTPPLRTCPQWFLFDQLVGETACCGFPSIFRQISIILLASRQTTSHLRLLK